MTNGNKILNAFARLLLKRIPDVQPTNTQAETGKPSINKTAFPAKSEPNLQAKQIKLPTQRQDQPKIERNNKQDDIETKSPEKQPSPGQINKPDDGPGFNNAKLNQANITQNDIKDFLDNNESFLVEYLDNNESFLIKYLGKAGCVVSRPSDSQLVQPVEENDENTEEKDLFKVIVNAPQALPGGSEYLIPEEASQGKDLKQIIIATKTTVTSETSSQYRQEIKDDSDSVDILKLDREQIAKINEESERAAILFDKIFSDPEDINDLDPELDTKITDSHVKDEAESSTILGLDANLSALAKRLMDRPQWSRAELALVTNSLDLLLDGALESINEASYEILEVPFLEGNDPIEINIEAMSKLKP